MNERFLEYLKKAEVEYGEFFDLSQLSYIRIGAVAECIVYPCNTDELIDVIKVTNELSLRHIVVGRMSNILFKNRVYNGVVITTDRIKHKNVVNSSIKLDTGCFLPPIARQLAKCGLGGFEGLLGIPGSIGGMIRQNAGAFGYSISDRFVCAEVYDYESDQITTLPYEEMQFGYRKSILCSRDTVLLNATFDLLPKAEDEFCREVSEYADARRRAQPTDQFSLGSVFKRCDGISAGYYIDLLGLKGFTVGGARVSTKHAGFIVNTGVATADDVLRVIEIIKSKVFDEFGIALEEEIEII